jgi:hypothetical protein
MNTMSDCEFYTILCSIMLDRYETVVIYAVCSTKKIMLSSSPQCTEDGRDVRLLY